MMELRQEDLASELAEDLAIDGPLFNHVDIITSTQGILVSEELFYRQIEEWISFTRKDFDCHVNGEPYQAVNFLINLESGQFIVRVWSRTVKTGYLADPDSVRDKIQETFKGKVPSTGFFQEDQEQVGKILFSDFPYSRMMSSQCNFLTKLKPEAQESHRMVCKACRVVDNDNFDTDAALHDDGDTQIPEQSLRATAKLEDQSDPDPNYNLESPSHLDDMAESPEPEEESSRISTSCSSASSKAKRDIACDLCDDTFTSKTAKMNHMHDVHSEKTPFSCDLCGKKFAKNVSLKYHQAGVHGIVTIPCKVCKMKFPNVEEFMEHYQSAHNEEETVACYKCKEKGWKSVDILSRKLICLQQLILAWSSTYLKYKSLFIFRRLANQQVSLACISIRLKEPIATPISR